MLARMQHTDFKLKIYIFRNVEKGGRRKNAGRMDRGRMHGGRMDVGKDATSRF